jgi:hypothetical protein
MPVSIGQRNRKGLFFEALLLRSRAGKDDSGRECIITPDQVIWPRMLLDKELIPRDPVIEKCRLQLNHEKATFQKAASAGGDQRLDSSSRGG